MCDASKNKVRPGHLCALLMRYPKARFLLMHNMCWVRTIDPYSLCDTLRRTIHAVPSNKVFAFGGDCWWPSASVAHAALARAWLSRALQAEVNDGLLNEREAMACATRLMHENQFDCFDVAERRAALLAATHRAG